MPIGEIGRTLEFEVSLVDGLRRNRDRLGDSIGKMNLATLVIRTINRA